MKKVIVSAIVMQNGKTLFARRADDGRYTPPGGKAESNESLEEAVARELLEETGITAKKIIFIGFEDLRNKVIFFYYIKEWEGEIVNREPHKHQDWEWKSYYPMDVVEGMIRFKKKLISTLEAIIINDRYKARRIV